MKCTTWVVALALLVMPQVSRGSEEEALKKQLSTLPYRVLYESYQQDNWEILSIKPDGSDKKNLTNTKDFHEMYPQASPDGAHVCFVQDQNNNGTTVRSVCIMDADGGNRKVICENARQPAWSPDGKQVAFVKMEFNKFKLIDFASKGLFFYEVASGKTTQHENKEIEHIYGLTWSPAQNGKWLFTTVHAGMGHKHAIIAIEMDGQRVLKMGGVDGCRPCVSPDGTKLVWCWGDSRIGLVDLTYGSDGPKPSGHRAVYQTPKAIHLYHADFSPDGRYVTFSAGPGGRMRVNGPGTHIGVSELVGVRGKWDIWIRKADGTGPAIPLTTDGETSSSKQSEWTVLTGKNGG